MIVAIATAIRSYINSRVKACDPDFEEWVQLYTQDETPNLNIDCAYHIAFGDITDNQGSIELTDDDMSVTLTLWKNGRECTTEVFEKFIDKVYCLKNDIISPTNWVSPLVRVSSTNISNSPVDGNASIMEIRVQLIFKVSYYL